MIVDGFDKYVQLIQELMPSPDDWLDIAVAKVHDQPDPDARHGLVYFGFVAETYDLALGPDDPDDKFDDLIDQINQLGGLEDRQARQMFMNAATPFYRYMLYIRDEPRSLSDMSTHNSAVNYHYIAQIDICCDNGLLDTAGAEAMRKLGVEVNDESLWMYLLINREIGYKVDEDGNVTDVYPPVDHSPKLPRELDEPEQMFADVSFDLDEDIDQLIADAARKAQS